MSRIKESDNELGTSINSKLTNKLMFVGLKARGILSPAYWRGGKFNSPGRKPWGKVKIVTEPRATCEGVACAGVAGDAKPQASGWQTWMRVDIQIINA